MHPTLIPHKRLIANVEGVMNAVLVKGDAVGATLYYGAGAGAEPTASAVIADLVDVTRMHTADPEHRVPHLAFQPDQLTDVPFLPMGEVETSYYLRMRVEDKPGVLADITRILADREISIDAMIQKEPSEGEDADRHHPAHAPLDRERASSPRSRRSRRCRRSAARSCASAWKSSQLMRYVSTRGAWAVAPQPFSAILLEGLAPDGGLAVPEAYPRFTPAELEALRPLGYRDLAFAVLSRFIDDIPPRDLRAIIDRTYTRATSSAATTSRRCSTLEPGLSPAARVERPDARVQGHRAAAARQPVRVRAGAPSSARSTSSARRRATPAAPPSTRCAASAASACSCCRRRAG